MWQALFGRGGRNDDDTTNDEAVARALQASLDDETRRRRGGGADAFIDLGDVARARAGIDFLRCVCDL